MSGTALLRFNKYPDISYGVYLYAWPINKMILWHFPAINVYVAMVVVFVLSVFAGGASSYLVERPFMMAKKLFRQRIPQTS
jgi:peptidoglycan/LPS O-acetylase OafA/YrhL